MALHGPGLGTLFRGGSTSHDFTGGGTVACSACTVGYLPWPVFLSTMAGRMDGWKNDIRWRPQPDRSIFTLISNNTGKCLHLISRLSQSRYRFLASLCALVLAHLGRCSRQLFIGCAPHLMPGLISGPALSYPLLACAVSFFVICAPIAHRILTRFFLLSILIS